MEFPYRGLTVFLRSKDSSVASFFTKKVLEAIRVIYAGSPETRALLGVVGLAGEAHKVESTEDYRGAVTLYVEERDVETTTLFDSITSAMYDLLPKIKEAEGEDAVKAFGCYAQPVSLDHMVALAKEAEQQKQKEEPKMPEHVEKLLHLLRDSGAEVSVLVV